MGDTASTSSSYISRTKRTRMESDSRTAAQAATHILASFASADNEVVGPALDLPVDVSTHQLEIILNQLLSNEEHRPYVFFINDTEVRTNVRDTLIELKDSISTETNIQITYRPQNVFRVMAVTRCSSTLEGHADAILSVAFSPDGHNLATGSGDKTIRFWDVDTQTPLFTGKGHNGWVLFVAFSPNGKFLASGSMDNDIRIWDPKTGEQIGRPLKGHSKWVTALSWEPLHSNIECSRLVSSSKDGTAKIWDVVKGNCLLTLASHTLSVTCVRWGGEGLIYTGSQDRSIKVWAAENGKLVRSLEGHAHWVNTLALSTDYVLRTGAYSNGRREFESAEEEFECAKKRYQEVRQLNTSKPIPERLVSGSDDFTMYLWDPANSKKPITRLTGHQQLVNQVSFSPDGRTFASASFDKAIKIWETATGKFLTTLRGHVGAVYQVAWSADSRMLVSGSKDSTMKVWDMKTFKLKHDLPGHADEVYSVDWSPDGERVASGSKDKCLKIWRH
eukprot:TRINITY_DN82_c0_g1_i1.p1 TRINITY_DN82_c0_g1~~TRINITY_DN82_c0_g1_i1.p1  ORF type:complete len:504 (-),score=89.12 TRINITY_DN82_c0_g1_i1:1349-2860(-)